MHYNASRYNLHPSEPVATIKGGNVVVVGLIPSVTVVVVEGSNTEVNETANNSM